MVDLSYIPHTKLESYLVLHVHDECEVLNELWGHLVTAKETKLSIVGKREPIHEPKIDHEAAGHLFLDFVVELLLIWSTQSIHGSHLGELQAILHVLKRTLE